MVPLVPRMQVFEIDDQTWFPAFFRDKVQRALTITWITFVPYIQSITPAQLVARLLATQLKSTIHSYVFIDFCAGGGGPTPSIEKHLNQTLLPTCSAKTNGSTSHSSKEPIQFVLTDIHPHISFWREAADNSPNLSYVSTSVDAANVPADLVGTYKSQGKKVFRLFNLAFHHFDDPLAKRILRNTIETSDGFGIFELQERNFSGFLACLLLGVGIVALAPYYAYKWRSPATLFFTYLIPILPVVLVWDGFMSALRTRTPEETEALLRDCGAATDISASWEVRSGKEMFMWPVGEVNWIMCVKKER